jgi:kynurenine formamidase
MHVGTHLDVKKHLFDSLDGIESLDVNKFIGKATVLKPIIENGIIHTTDIIQQYQKKHNILLLNCDFSKNYNTLEYFTPPKFERDIIPFLIKNNIEIIGFDLPSPEYIDGDFLDMHRDLLGHNILIIENLTNLDLLKKECDFIGLPLKIKGFDGSMLRCVAKND